MVPAKGARASQPQTTGAAAPAGRRGSLASRMRGLARPVRALAAIDGAGRAALLASAVAAALFAAGIAALALLGDAAPPPVAADVRLAVPPAIDRASSVAAEGDLIVQPFGRALLAALPALPPAQPLPPAPDPDLLEATDAGRLPKVAKDGRQPWQVYARPFERRDDRARLVLIIAGIGLAPTASQAAIDLLPPAVVLAIDAYAPRPEEWARAARQAGHEVLATLPLQQARASLDDAGPAALLSDAATQETMRRLDAVLGRLTGYVGVLALGGGGFGDRVEALQPVANALHQRGLLLADGTTTAAAGRLPLRAAPGELPRRGIDVVFDAEPVAAAIDRELAALATQARLRFVAVGLGRPSALTIARLRAFLAGLDEARYVVAPISAVASTGE